MCKEFFEEKINREKKNQSEIIWSLSFEVYWKEFQADKTEINFWCQYLQQQHSRTERPKLKNLIYKNETRFHWRGMQTK